MTAADRRQLIGRAALDVLGRDGARALTHRAVDTAAGLPAGSVNYYVPTREQLLTAALDALFEQDVAVARRAAAPSTPDEAVDFLAALVRRMTTPRSRVVARHELLCEAQRRPAFRRRFEQQRREFVALAATLLRSVGAPGTDAAADALVVVIDGLVSRQVLLGAPRLSPAAVADALRPYVTAAGGPARSAAAPRRAHP